MSDSEANATKSRRIPFVLLILSAVCFVPGYAAPLVTKTITTGDDVLDHVIASYVDLFSSETYSLIAIVIKFFGDGELFLATVIFLFSIVFPTAKVTLLFFLLATSPSRENRFRESVLHVLERAGGWSFFDVFVVVVLFASVNHFPFARIEPEWGSLSFAAAVLMSMVASIQIGRIENAARPTHGVLDQAPLDRRRQLIATLAAVCAAVALIPGLFGPSFALEPGMSGAVVEATAKSAFPSVFGVTSLSLLQTSTTLFATGKLTLGLLFLGFTVLFPVGKLAVVFVLLGSRRTTLREWSYKALHTFAGWSLLLVVAAAIALATVKELPGGTRIVMNPGLWCFVVAATCSFVAERLAAQPATVQLDSP